MNRNRRALLTGLGGDFGLGFFYVREYWIRIAPSVYNDMRDVERLLNALS